MEDFFHAFITMEMISDIVRHTNAEGFRRFGERWQDTCVSEICKFIGLLLLAGVYTSKNESVKQLWNGENGRPIFGKAMPRDRFVRLSSMLRFDDRESRSERRATDKLAPFRSMWNKFISKCRSNYVPHDHMTIDEQLVTFRGRCPFRMYIPSKPGRYGIKIWLLCDSTNSYCYNGDVYTGRQGNLREVNQSSRVVLELTEPLTNSGRNIVGDNFFSSLHLVQCLKARRLSYLGTIRRNKAELPTEFQPTRQRPVESTIFGFSDDAMIVSYVPKRSKAVNLISSLHNEQEISNDRSKPQVILDYNSLKGGVDTLDQNVRKYSCKRRTLRWPMALFSNMVDIAAYNSFVIHLDVHPQWERRKSHRRRLFLIALARQLIGIPEQTEGQAVQVRRPEAASRPVAVARRRCASCGWNRDRKTKFRCQKCDAPVCMEHACIFCHQCEPH